MRYRIHAVQGLSAASTQARIALPSLCTAPGYAEHVLHSLCTACAQPVHSLCTACVGFVNMLTKLCTACEKPLVMVIRLCAACAQPLHKLHNAVQSLCTARAEPVHSLCTACAELVHSMLLSLEKPTVVEHRLYTASTQARDAMPSMCTASEVENQVAHSQCTACAQPVHSLCTD
jgi:hypothetical protein